MKHLSIVLVGFLTLAVVACKKNKTEPQNNTTQPQDSTINKPKPNDSPVVHPHQIVTYTLSYFGYTHESSYSANPPTSFDTTYPNTKTVTINFIVNVDTFVILGTDTVKKYYPGVNYYKKADNYSGTQYVLTDTSIDINWHTGSTGYGASNYFHGTRK